MQLIVDLHIHSRFARACSKFLTLPSLDNWARAKGIDLLGTADFTHPVWFSEITEQLEPVREGIFRLKPKFRDRSISVAGNPEVEFLLSSEVATIWSQDGKLRRMHTILLAPSLKAAAKLNAKLGQRWKLGSDGRPILGMSAKALAETAWSIDEQFLVIPAHAWTPWFAIFGSQSGFDSIAECYGDVANRIYAIETGFSSDPAMNWRVSALDTIALVSCSDAHSLNNLGREATIFEVADRDQLTYSMLVQMIKEGSPRKRQEFLRGVGHTSEVVKTGRLTLPAKHFVSVSDEVSIIHQKSSCMNYLWGTLEFFPQEGKYHSDGHRACGVRFSPAERKAIGGTCPACGQPVTIGVASRVDDLADRVEGFVPEGAPQVEYVVPLHELVAATLGVGKLSKRVSAMVDQLRASLGSEFQILRSVALKDIERVGTAQLATLVDRLRRHELTMEPGYDGVYGTLVLPNCPSVAQSSLFQQNGL